MGATLCARSRESERMDATVRAKADTAAADAARDKLRGGYYTPDKVVRWLCAWAIQNATDRVLEPSCGDGAFLVAAADRLSEVGCSTAQAARQLTGIEINADEARKAAGRLSPSCKSSVHHSDFFAWVKKNAGQSYDCVVGNPPFIRYQNFPEPSRTLAMQLMEAEGLRPNRLTNIWVPFVVGAVSRLAEGGRLAMVLPAELLQVTYAAQLRSYLADSFHGMEIFACNESFFDGAEQEIVLLLATGKLMEPSKSHVCRIELTEAKDLQTLLKAVPGRSPKGSQKTVNHSTEKWLKYFLTGREISFMRALRESNNVAPLSEHASIDVGVVTGRNEFFVVPQETVDEYGLQEHVMPLVGRSAQLKGAVVNQAEWRSFAGGGHGVYLLSIDPGANGSLGKGIKKYIREGELQDFHTGYKCSIREPWYSVPSIWKPDCFFFRQIYDFPRVVLNRAKATSTDTIHRMRCKSDPQATASNLYSHLTAASAEIEGRSYGGGVLELEPTEAERLMVPREFADALPLKEVDQLVRAGKIDEVLLENDRRVLMKGVGLSAKDCALLRGIWSKMRDRRMSRRRNGRP